ncbi:hypothetical protein ABI59_04215 [Acidobacteria bacterium Mor1]|nr:hypothetical protein ABI59_04215 [Acidobacteria bacterium Mor1]
MNLAHRRIAPLGFAVLALLLCTASFGEEKPIGRGTVLWSFDDELDAIGVMAVDAPLRIGPRHSFYFGLSTRTSILQANSESFLVQDLDYTAEVGVRQWRTGSAGLRVAAFAGQQGTQQIDRDGQPWVRYAGASAESDGFRRQEPGFQWRGRGAVVVDEREVEADGLLQGSLRYRFGNGRNRRVVFGLEAEVDALIDGSEDLADWSIGPSVGLKLRGNRFIRLFAHYQESKNPLGLGVDGAIVGIDFSEGDPGGGRRLSPPDLRGHVSGGAGDDGRLAGRFVLELLTPSFGESGDYRGVFLVDSHVLTAEDTGEAYWFYHLGVERARDDHVIGAYLYHRSNHALAEPNDRITSINVLEVGIETDRWDRPGTRWSDAPYGVFDARARVGWVINSSFGEDRRYHVRGGVRWTAPVGPGRTKPFLLVELEDGDVKRRRYAAGLATGSHSEVLLEFRNDEQYFAADQTAVVLLGSFEY